MVKLRANCSHASPRFAETEVIAAIDILVPRYRFEVKDEPEFIYVNIPVAISQIALQSYSGAVVIYCKRRW